MKLGLIVDIVLVLILVAVLAVGAKRGFIKMAYGFLGSVLALVIAVVAVSPITQIIVKETQWDEALTQKISAPIASNIPNSGASIFYHDLDGDGTKELAVDLGQGPEKFENIFSGTPYSSFSKLLEPLIKSKLPDQEGTVVFINVVTAAAVTLIFTIIGFILLWIIARILLAIIFAVARKLVDKTYIFHFLDKVLGGAMGAVMGVLVIFVAMTIIQFMQDLSFMGVVMDTIKESTLGKFVYGNNFIYNFITSIDIKNIFAGVFKV